MLGLLLGLFATASIYAGASIGSSYNPTKDGIMYPNYSTGYRNRRFNEVDYMYGSVR